MDEIAGTLMPILQALLPGFLAMVVFYWLADAKKPGQFEQVIQALICTGLIKILVDGIPRKQGFTLEFVRYGEDMQNA